jgi:hypothetical protein
MRRREGDQKSMARGTAICGDHCRTTFQVVRSADAVRPSRSALLQCWSAPPATWKVVLQSASGTDGRVGGSAGNIVCHPNALDSGRFTHQMATPNVVGEPVGEIIHRRA